MDDSIFRDATAFRVVDGDLSDRVYILESNNAMSGFYMTFEHTITEQSCKTSP